MVPFGVPIIIRHLLLGYPKRDHNFDNYPNRNPNDSTERWAVAGVLRQLLADAARVWEGLGSRDLDFCWGFWFRSLGWIQCTCVSHVITSNRTAALEEST